jgi:hypothetical protein
MQAIYTSENAKSTNTPGDAVLIPEAEYRRDLKKLNDFAFVFLSAVNGDTAQAERLLDDFVDLILEAGVLSTWRYRLLLGMVHEGL